MAKDIGAFDKNGLHAELFTSVPARPQFKRWWAGSVDAALGTSNAVIAATMAVLYAWGWIMRVKSWMESLAAMTITE